MFWIFARICSVDKKQIFVKDIFSKSVPFVQSRGDVVEKSFQLDLSI